MPYAVTEIFDVVNDVDRYQEFLPGCRESAVLNATPTTYDAGLEVAAYGIHEKIVTRNTPTCNRSLKLELIEGPFAQLEGNWSFTDYGEGCRVSLELTCEFASRLLNVFSNTLMKRGIEKTVEAFIAEVRRRHDSS